MNFLQEQIFTFAVAVSYGFFIGVVLDFYRSFFRYKKSVNYYVVNLLDVFLWILLTILFLFILLSSNWGEVRAYIFLALGIGVLIYYVLLSYFILKTLDNIFSFILFMSRLINKKLIKK